MAEPSPTGAASEGDPGHALHPENRYRGYGKDIIPDHVFLTSKYEAFDPDFLVEHQIGRVLTLADECEPPVASLVSATSDKSAASNKLTQKDFKFVPVRESPFTTLPFEEARAFLDTAVREKKRVLVHCREGRNRSAAVLISWLLTSELVPDLLAAQKIEVESVGVKTGKQNESKDENNNGTKPEGTGSPKLEKKTIKNTLQLGPLLDMVKGRRSLVDPNVGYRKQLIDLEFRRVADMSMTAQGFRQWVMPWACQLRAIESKKAGRMPAEGILRVSSGV